MTESKAARLELARRSLAYFALIYLPHYITAKVPGFHKELYELLQKDEVRFLEIIAFRGSGKSTIASLALPLWTALFQRRHFIVLISNTHIQAKAIIANLIKELESNPRIIADFGNVKAPGEEWSSTNVLLRSGVRILSRSSGQEVRGMRHMQYRPELIIADDVEDIESVRTKEQRDKTEEWLFSDVMPTLDPLGKFVLLGNFLHMDSLVNRTKKKILSRGSGTVREYPLINADGVNVWPEMYTDDRIAEIRTRNERFFQREYQLQVMASDDQTIKKVVKYDRVSPDTIRRVAIGVDLAISQSQTADNTSIAVVGAGDDMPMYSLENHAGKWSFNETLERIKLTWDRMQTLYPHAVLLLGVEKVQYQEAVIQELQRRYALPAVGIPQTRDKRAKFEMLAPYFENGQILLRSEGDEDLENELLGLGVEAHDDRADSLELAMRQLIDNQSTELRWL